MTISPILQIERKKRGALVIIQVIDDGGFIYTCKVFQILPKHISHAFVYDSNFAQKK